MDLQALFVVVMESGIQEQVQIVEVKGLFRAVWLRFFDKRRNVIPNTWD